jgi:hypothetical protein
MEPVYPTPSSSPTAAAPDPGPGSAFTVLFAPVKTFLGLAGRPRVLIPILLLAIATAAAQVAVQSKVDPSERQVQLREGFEKRGLAGAELDKAMQDAEAWSGATTPIVAGFTLVVVPLVLLFFAAIYLLGFRLAGASALTFLQALSLTAHSAMPAVVQQLFTIPVAMGRSTVTMAEAAGGLLLSNLSFLASEGTSNGVRALLASVDVFSLWSLALTVVGAAVMGRISRGAAAAVALTIWILGVLLRVGLSSLFG